MADCTITVYDANNRPNTYFKSEEELKKIFSYYYDKFTNEHYTIYRVIKRNYVSHDGEAIHNFIPQYGCHPLNGPETVHDIQLAGRVFEVYILDDFLPRAQGRADLIEEYYFYNEHKSKECGGKKVRYSQSTRQLHLCDCTLKLEGFLIRYDINGKSFIKMKLPEGCGLILDWPREEPISGHPNELKTCTEWLLAILSRTL